MQEKLHGAHYIQEQKGNGHERGHVEDMRTRKKSSDLKMIDLGKSVNHFKITESWSFVCRIAQQCGGMEGSSNQAAVILE